LGGESGKGRIDNPRRRAFVGKIGTCEKKLKNMRKGANGRGGGGADETRQRRSKLGEENN